jgi:hypothetical protein
MQRCVADAPRPDGCIPIIQEHVDPDLPRD